MRRAIIIVNKANDRITTDRFITKPPVASGSVLSAFLGENSTSPRLLASTARAKLLVLLKRNQKE